MQRCKIISQETQKLVDVGLAPEQDEIKTKQHKKWPVTRKNSNIILFQNHTHKNQVVSKH